MVWGAILFHGLSNLLQIEGNLDSNRCVHEVLQPEVVPFLQGIPGFFFQRDNERSHIAKNFRSAQHMQLISWPAYSPNISPIEQVWNLVCRCLARYPRFAPLKDELWLCIKAIWDSLPLADIQKLFDSMPRSSAALIAVHGSYTKSWFRTLNLFPWKFRHLFALIQMVH